MLQSYYVYPFVARFEDGCSNREILKETSAVAEDWQPTGVLWSHADKLDLCPDHLNIIKSINFIRDIADASKMAKALLAKEQSNLDRIACDYSDFALKRLSMYRTLEHMTAVLKDVRGSRLWNKSLDCRVNSWIGNVKF